MQIDVTGVARYQAKSVNVFISSVLKEKSNKNVASLKTLYSSILEPHFRYGCSACGCCGTMKGQKADKVKLWRDILV